VFGTETVRKFDRLEAMPNRAFDIGADGYLTKPFS